MGRYGTMAEVEKKIWARFPDALIMGQELVQQNKAKGPACNGKAEYVLGKVLWTNGDYRLASEYLIKAGEHCLAAGESETAARSYLALGNVYYYQGYYDSAFRWFDASLGLFTSLGHKTGRIEVLHDLALMSHRKGDFASCIKYLFECERLKDESPEFVHYVGDFSGVNGYFVDTLYYREEIADELKNLDRFRAENNPTGVYQSHINLGIADKELGNHLQAARHFSTGCGIMSRVGDFPFWDLAGIEYRESGMRDSAFYFHYRAKREFPYATQIKIGYTYELLGNAHSYYGQTDSALWYLEKALEMNLAMNNRITVAGLHASLARLKMRKGNFQAAEQHLERGIRLANQVSVKHLSNLYKLAKEFYKLRNDPDSALLYSELYTGLSEQIDNTEKAMALIRFQAQFETSKRETELLAAHNKLSNQTLVLVSLTVLTLLLGGFLLLAYRQRQKIKQQNEKLSTAFIEQKALMQEIHHRVKNNLQYIVSLLNLRTQYLRDPQLIDHIEEIKTRIMTIGTIHERLYKSQGLEHIELKPFVEELIQNLFRALPARKEVTRQLEITPVSIDVERAISIGLIINELVTNAVKHALVRHESPHFRLQIGEQNNMLVMEIEDNGPGFVLDSSQDGFGHKLIQLLLRKMQGSISQKTKTCLHLVFKLN